MHGYYYLYYTHTNIHVYVLYMIHIQMLNEHIDVDVLLMSIPLLSSLKGDVHINTFQRRFPMVISYIFLSY